MAPTSMHSHTIMPFGESTKGPRSRSVTSKTTVSRRGGGGGGGGDGRRFGRSHDAHDGSKRVPRGDVGLDAPRYLPNPLRVKSVSAGNGAAGGAGGDLPQPPVTIRGIRKDTEAINAAAGVASPSVGHRAAPAGLDTSYADVAPAPGEEVRPPAGGGQYQSHHRPNPSSGSTSLFMASGVNPTLARDTTQDGMRGAQGMRAVTGGGFSGSGSGAAINQPGGLPRGATHGSPTVRPTTSPGNHLPLRSPPPAGREAAGGQGLRPGSPGTRLYVELSGVSSDPAALAKGAVSHVVNVEMPARMSMPSPPKLVIPKRVRAVGGGGALSPIAAAVGARPGSPRSTFHQTFPANAADHTVTESPSRGPGTLAALNAVMLDERERSSGPIGGCGERIEGQRQNDGAMSIETLGGTSIPGALDAPPAERDDSAVAADADDADVAADDPASGRRLGRRPGTAGMLSASEEGFISAVQFGFRSRPSTSRTLPLGAGWAVGQRRNLARNDLGEGLGFNLTDLVGQDFVVGGNAGRTGGMEGSQKGGGKGAGGGGFSVGVGRDGRVGGGGGGRRNHLGTSQKSRTRA